jgi:hypothetical protein
MLEHTARDDARACFDPSSRCTRCDVLIGLDGFRVVVVKQHEGERGAWLRVVVETPTRIVGRTAAIRAAVRNR